MELSDLISGCKKRELKAEREFFYAYAKKVHALARKYTLDMQEADDMMQECFIRVYSQMDKFEESKGKSMNQLLGEFKTLRMQNLGILTALNIQESDLFKEGIHPKFGKVTLRHLLSTWTVHDLSHIAQITRVMCKQYKEEVGPWIEFLPILTRY